MALCGRSCEKCRYRRFCGGCSLCEFVLCKRKCNKCFALCFERPGAEALLGKVEADIKPNKDIVIPYHIPVLPDVLKQKPDFQMMTIVAVHGGNMFSRKGENIYNKYKEQGYQGALNLDGRTEALLEFYVRDKTLEGFWDNRKEIYQDLKEMGFKAVIAPNFSVYEDAPRLDHLYNINRSKRVYNELLDQGINAIPDVVWFNKKDLDTWAEDICKNNIKLIAFSFQVVDVGLKPSNLWRSSLLGFRYLCQNIPRDIKIIIAGVVSPFRVQEVHAAAGGRGIHVINQSAYVQSRRGILSETRQSCRELDFEELFRRNIKYYNEIYQSINESDRVGRIMAMSKEEIVAYMEGKDEDNRLDNELSRKLIERVARKRKIKVEGWG